MLPEAIRQELVTLNQALPETGLVTWTSTNVSICDPETGYVTIEASGAKFRDLTAESIVVVDLEGNLIGGEEIGKIVVESIGLSAAVTVGLALQLGQPDEIPAEMIEKLHQRY